MKRQVTSEPTKNFSIASAVQKKTTYLKLVSVEFLGFTVNFVIKGDIQKIDVNRKIILEGQYKSINATIEDIDHLQILPIFLS